MIYIFKSYFKSYFKNWIESLGLIFFIIIVFATTIGIISSPIQFNNNFNSISGHNKKWSGDVTASSNDLNHNFLYDYFVDNNTQFNILEYNNTKNIFKDNQLSALGGKDILSYLQDYYKNSGEDVKGEIGNFILNQVINKLYYPSGQIPSEREVLVPATSGGLIHLKLDQVIIKSYLDKNIYTNLINVISDYSNKNGKLFINNFSSNFYYNYKKEGVLNYFLVNRIDDANQSNTLNHLVLQGRESRLPQRDNEILINKKYALKHDLKINDTIVLNDIKSSSNYNLPNSFKIVGFALKPSDVIPVDYFSLLTGDINNYATIFMLPNLVDRFNNFFYDNISEVQHYSYANLWYWHVKLNNITEQDFSNVFNSLIYNKENKLLDYAVFDHFEFTKYNSLYFMQQIQLLRIQIIVFSIIGIVLLGLSFVFINFFMRKEISNTRKEIGIFKATGYSDASLAWAFSFKTALTVIFGSIIGFCASFPIQGLLCNFISQNMTIYINPIYGAWWFVFLTIVIIPMIFVVISFFLTWKYLNIPALGLLTSQEKIKKPFIKFNIHNIFRKTNYLLKLQFSFLKNSFLKLLAVFIIFFVGNFLLIMQFDSVKYFTGFANSIMSGNTKTVDHFFDLPINELKYDSKNKGLVIPDGQDKYMSFYSYENKEELYKINTFTKSDEWHNLIQEYISDSDAGKDITEDLLTIFTGKTLINSGIRLNDLINLLEHVKKDASKIPITIPNVNLSKIEQLKSYMSQQNTNPIISFNSLYYQQNQEFLASKYITTPSYDRNYKAAFWRLFALDPDANNSDFFNFSGISKNTLSEVFNRTISNPNEPIPVIINLFMNKLEGLKVGDTFSAIFASINGLDKNANNTVKFVVKGISKTDMNFANFYASNYNLWSNHLIGYNQMNPDNLKNTLISKKQILDGDINFSNIGKTMKNIKLNNDDWSYYLYNKNFVPALPKGSYGNYNLADFFKNIKYAKVINEPSFLSSSENKGFSFNLFSLEKSYAKWELHKTENIFIVFKVIISITFLVILLTVCFSVLDEKKKTILTLKSLGYYNYEISLISIGHYVMVIILSIGFSFLIEFIFWWLFIPYIAVKTLVLSTIPMGTVTSLIDLGIIIPIIIMSLYFSWHNVANKNIVELMLE